MPAGLVFRDADPSEDYELARIMYNSFLPIWLHNWFACLTEPIPAISRSSGPLLPLQARRLDFYRAWINLNRAHNGDVMVAYTPTTTPGPENSSPSIPSGPIAAVVLLLPPHARPCWSESLLAWRTGFLPGLLKLGLRGFWRAVLVFEGNVGNMIAKGLKDADIEGGNEVNLVFVQACCRNPEWEGESGPGRKLLDWGIRRRWQRDRKIPVWLDCFSDDAEAAYKHIGFKLLGDCMVDTGCDSEGIKLKTDAGEKKREEGKRVAKQRVMVRIPET